MGRSKGRAYSKYNSTQRSTIAAQCMDLRLRGKTYQDIAKITGVPYQTVYRWVKQEIDKTVTPAAEDARNLEVARYDRYLDRLEADFDKPNVDIVRLIVAAMKIAERRARLLGLDMPIKVEAQVMETTQADMEWAEMVREAQARDALNREADTAQAGDRKVS